MLPLPYLRSFYGGPGDKLLKQKWVLNLENQAETFVWKCIESRVMSDDSGNIYIDQYWSNLKKIADGKRNTTINMQNWGNFFYFNGCNRW